MALKDLIASKASLAEDVIEEIVSEFVRFDADEKAVFLTPESDSLSTRAKVLVYLVALQGWPFVLDEVVPVDAKPADIEKQTGISGGTLRPTLKELKERKVVIERGGRYSVLSTALRTIKAELDGSRAAPTSRGTKRKARRSAPRESEPDKGETPSHGEAVVKKRSRRSGSTSAAESFGSWVQAGFFDKPKTLSDVQQRFHQEGLIVPRTSIPGHLLKAIRGKRLTRQKADMNGKSVWAYTTRR